MQWHAPTRALLRVEAVRYDHVYFKKFIFHVRSTYLPESRSALQRCVFLTVFCFLFFLSTYVFFTCFLLLRSSSVRPRSEALAQPGRAGDDVDVRRRRRDGGGRRRGIGGERRRRRRRGEPPAGALRRHPVRLAGAPRQLRHHRGVRQGARQEAVLAGRWYTAGRVGRPKRLKIDRSMIKKKWWKNNFCKNIM